MLFRRRCSELIARVFMVHNELEPVLTVITFLPRCESQMNTIPDFPWLFLCSSLHQQLFAGLQTLPGGWGSQNRIKGGKKVALQALQDKLDHYPRTAIVIEYL